MGANHARVYSEMRGVDDVLCYDVDFSRANHVSASHGSASVESIEDLFNFVDLVSVCTPTPLHHETCRLASNAGVPFLVEKPVADSVVHAAEILHKAPVGSGVGHIERFNPVTNLVFPDGCSPPSYVSIRRHNPGSARITDTHVVDDLMIHDVDIVCNVLFDSDPDEIQSVVGYGVAHALLRFGDSVVSLSASRRSFDKVREVRAEFEMGTVVGNFVTQDVVIHGSSSQSSFFSRGAYFSSQHMERVVSPHAEPLKAELSEFVRCVREKKEFPVTIEQATNNLKICEMIKNGSRNCNCGTGCKCR